MLFYSSGGLPYDLKKYHSKAIHAMNEVLFLIFCTVCKMLSVKPFPRCWSDCKKATTALLFIKVNFFKRSKSFLSFVLPLLAAPLVHMASARQNHVTLTRLGGLFAALMGTYIPLSFLKRCYVWTCQKVNCPRKEWFILTGETERKCFSETTVAHGTWMLSKLLPTHSKCPR